MIVVVIIVSAVAGAIAVASLIPISVGANGAAGEDELWGVAELRWGHSIMMVRMGTETDGRFYLFGIPLFRLPSIFDSDEKKKKKKEKKKKKKKKGKKREYPRLLRPVGDDRRLVVQMAGRALGALHPHLHIDGTVGFGDPANTALMLTAARQIDRLVTDRVHLDLHDDYLEDTTQLFGRVRAWVIPAEVVLILLVWVVRTDTRRVLRGR